MSQTNAALHEPTPDPRHTFLATKDVFTRYRWKRTKGYQTLKSEGFPSDLHGAHRLDLLMAWEDQCLTDLLTDQTGARPPTPGPPVRSTAAPRDRSHSGGSCPPPQPGRPEGRALMPRPRKDGTKARPAIRIGRQRLTDTGKAWRVRALGPSVGAPYGRITHIPPGKTKPTSNVPADGQTLEELFDQIERYYDHQVAISGREEMKSSSRKDMERLGALYIDHLTIRDRSEGYIGNRECIIRKWIVPVIGDVAVQAWTPDDSEGVLKNARMHVGAKRVEDIGSALAGMRGVAHAKRAGGRWLDPTDNPLEGVSYSRKANRQGQDRSFVPLHLRPSLDSAQKAEAAAVEVGRWIWMPDIINLAGSNAMRLAEQLGFRAIDTDFFSW